MSNYTSDMRRVEEQILGKERTIERISHDEERAKRMLTQAEKKLQEAQRQFNKVKNELELYQKEHDMLREGSAHTTAEKSRLQNDVVALTKQRADIQRRIDDEAKRDSLRRK